MKFPHPYFPLPRGEKRKTDSSFVAEGAAKQEIDSTGEIQCIPKDSLGFDIPLLRYNLLQ